MPRLYTEKEMGKIMKALKSRFTRVLDSTYKGKRSIIITKGWGYCALFVQEFEGGKVNLIHYDPYSTKKLIIVIAAIFLFVSIIVPLLVAVWFIIGNKESAKLTQEVDGAILEAVTKKVEAKK